MSPFPDIRSYSLFLTDNIPAVRDKMNTDVEGWTKQTQRLMCITWCENSATDYIIFFPSFPKQANKAKNIILILVGKPHDTHWSPISTVPGGLLYVYKKRVKIRLNKNITQLLKYLNILSHFF